MLGSSDGITDTDDETTSSAGVSAGGALSLIKTSESKVVFFFFFFFFRFGSKISFKKQTLEPAKLNSIFLVYANHGYQQILLRIRRLKSCPKMFHCQSGRFVHCNIHSKVNSHNILKSHTRITLFTKSKLCQMDNSKG